MDAANGGLQRQLSSSPSGRGNGALLAPQAQHTNRSVFAYQNPRDVLLPSTSTSTSTSTARSPSRLRPPFTGQSFLSKMGHIAAQPETGYPGSRGAYAIDPLALHRGEADGVDVGAWQPKQRSHSWNHQEKKHELQHRLSCKSDERELHPGFSEIEHRGIEGEDGEGEEGDGDDGYNEEIAVDPMVYNENGG